MVRALVLILGTAVFAAAQDDLPWFDKLEPALKEATTGRPVFLDFEARWCYSCYYMEHHVLSRPAFQELAKTMVLVKLDADKKEGYRLREKYQVRALPTYLLLNSQGEEVGRIAGEQAEGEFLNKLKAILDQSMSPDQKLTALVEAGRLGEAQNFFRESIKVQPALDADQRWKLAAARLELEEAKKKNDSDGLVVALDKIFELEEGCDFAYDVMGTQEQVEKLEPLVRQRIWKQEYQKLDSLAKRRVFGKAKDRCADSRTVAAALLHVLSRLGLNKEWRSTVDRAIRHYEKISLDANLGRDRNAEDNWRYFLETAKRPKELDRLYAKLIEIYPLDYVYPYRYAKNLYSRKEYDQALLWVEKANLLCYGANLISVNHLRAQVLSALGRKSEALDLLKREIDANRGRFPKEITRLETLLGELSAAK